MKINMAENEYFPVGMILSCTTCHGQKLQGEVMAFDYQTRMLALKSGCRGSSDSKAGLHDIKLLNLNYVGDLKVIREPVESPPPLTNLNLGKIASRVSKSVEEKLKQVHYMGVGVTPHAQRLFHHITKTISDVRWENENIVVLDIVRITAPYQCENICLKEKDGRSQQTLQHVRKLVEKYYRDEARESSVSSTAST